MPGILYTVELPAHTFGLPLILPTEPKEITETVKVRAVPSHCVFELSRGKT